MASFEDMQKRAKEMRAAKRTEISKKRAQRIAQNAQFICPLCVFTESFKFLIVEHIREAHTKEEADNYE